MTMNVRMMRSLLPVGMNAPQDPLFPAEIDFHEREFCLGIHSLRVAVRDEPVVQVALPPPLFPSDATAVLSPRDAASFAAPARRVQAALPGVQVHEGFAL